MGKSSHFSGQPLYCQVLNFLNRSKTLQISREHGGERYVKSFNGWSHLVVMLYAVIMRFDSLRAITTSMLAEARKLWHIGIDTMPYHSTLADANKRRSEAVFEAIYRDLYATYRHRLYPGNNKKYYRTNRKQARISFQIFPHSDQYISEDYSGNKNTC